MVYKKILGKPDVLQAPFTFCPGCIHSLTHVLIGRALEELDIVDKTIMVIGVGCSALSYRFFNTDSINVPHGRAPAVATGVKAVHPDNIVFTYQGDGDLAAIGLLEIMHAANRGENFTTIFINNATYGMTGGQMAPTTLIGQKTSTTPDGRTLDEGAPMKMCEMINTLEKPVYIHRISMTKPGEIIKAGKAIKKAFRYQLEGKGFSFIEVLSNCPTNWKMTPVDSLKYINDEMKKVFPPMVFRDIYANQGGEKC
jgi:2-oxoglutarate/2-oxoacid ferredoxin oxidoreductase subunit beta